MARLSESFKSAARAQIPPATPRTSHQTPSEKYWRSANLSAGCFITSRANDPSVPSELSSHIHNAAPLAAFNVGIELTLQYLLVTFPQREIFSHSHYTR